MAHLTQATAGRRRGVVLVTVLIVLVLLTLVAYQYSELMLAEYTATVSYTRAAQSRALAESGIHYTAALLTSSDTQTSTISYNPYDNPQYFRDVVVHEASPGLPEGRFSIVSLQNPDDLAGNAEGYRFGVSDESARINLNALLELDGGRGDVGREMLLKLPNMTEDTASAILDWIDADETPRAGGAENETYFAQATPYRCKNGPLDSLEELLLVRGVTPLLLYGNDLNRNGSLDPGEDEGGGLDLGWAAYLTIYSRERNTDAEGNARLYLNDRDLSTLVSQLTGLVGEEVTTYIVAYRLYGKQSSGSGSQPAEGADLAQARQQITSDQNSGGRRRLRSIASPFDLVNSTVGVRVGQGSSQRTISYPSPLRTPDQIRQYLPVLLDKCTTTRRTDLPPRINVNTAAQAVLAALPGLTEADVQAIVDRRPVYTGGNAPDAIYDSTAWLLTEANLKPDTLRGLERFITARSQVYRFQVLGYFPSGGPVSRLEAVVDTNYGRPRIVYWRDLASLGRGYGFVRGGQEQ